ncbi:MAG: peroxide stress protein YaaA [Pseudomonadota bacterium]
MLIVISPAKRLDLTPVDMPSATEPAFQKDAYTLAKAARRLTQAELRKLMGISEPLAKLNQQRFKAFAEAPADDAVKPAALAFDGDTYQGLEARTLDAGDMAYAQRRLRILSGLYGLLRPLDRIQPYRLEMGSRLATRGAKTLYDFWRKKIAAALNADAEAQGAGLLLNCASQEYFGSVDLDALKLEVIEPVFLERRDGTEKMVSFFAKKARGAMARYAVETRAETVEDLKGFCTGGYEYQPEASEANRLVFVRDYLG